jgi:hypothetical protein
MKTVTICTILFIYHISFTQDFLVYDHQFGGRKPMYVKGAINKVNTRFTEHIFDIKKEKDTTYFSIGIFDSKSIHHKLYELIKLNDSLVFREKNFDSLPYF